MNATTTLPKMMSELDVVTMTGIPRGTLAYWRSCNTGPRSYRIGRRIRYDETDVLAWIQAQKAATSRGGVA